MIGEEKEVDIATLLNYNAAIAEVADNKLLNGVVAYRLGRLGDACKSPIKVFRKVREEKEKELRNKIQELNKTLSGKTDKEKAEIAEQIEKESSKGLEEINELQYSIKEKIGVPTFKLEDFVAQSDLTYVEVINRNTKDQKEVEVTIRSGQTLVPVRFFALMGEAITEEADKPEPKKAKK